MAKPEQLSPSYFPSWKHQLKLCIVLKRCIGSIGCGYFLEQTYCTLNCSPHISHLWILVICIP